MKRALAVGLMLAATNLGAADVTFGRLFLTPAQRTALEEARRKNIRAEEIAAEKATKPKRPPARDVVVSGVVKRSDGESTVWVNGKPVDGTTDDGLRVRVTSGRAAVVIHEPKKGHTVRLKVGQRANFDTGKIREPYEDRPTPAAVLPAPADTPPTAPAQGASASKQRDESEQKTDNNVSEPPADRPQGGEG